MKISVQKLSPKRSNSQVLGDVGQTSAKLAFEKYGWTADIIKSDYGEDIDVCVFINNTRTKFHFRCQVKSTGRDSKYVKKLSSGNYSIAIKTSLLKLWISCSFPVFLVVYDESNDALYWGNPLKQIFENAHNLSKNTINLHVSDTNKINITAKNDLLFEIEDFYKTLLRLDEATIQCDVIPVLMPDYKIISGHEYFEFIRLPEKIVDLNIKSLYLELLPSWMNVLKKIDPSPLIPVIEISKSENLTLERFLEYLKRTLVTLNYKLKKGEWISFIVSPIKTISRIDPSWQSELTYWNSYSYINKKLVSDYDYAFDISSEFLTPWPIRARSWTLMFINRNLDLAAQFYGCLDITPTVKNVDNIKSTYVKSQYLLWTCNNNEIDDITKIVAPFEYVVRILQKDDKMVIIAITTMGFDPFVGMFNSGISWENHEKLNVRKNILSKRIFKKLPGEIYTGEVPLYFKKAVDTLSGKEYERIFVTNDDAIPGFPIKHNKRLITIARFQMLPSGTGVKVKIDKEFEKLKRNKTFKNLDLEFKLVDDTWESPIVSFSISWQPDLAESSYNSFERLKEDIITIFNNILPTNEEKSLIFKNTYEILNGAGEIHFEDENH